MTVRVITEKEENINAILDSGSALNYLNPKQLNISKERVRTIKPMDVVFGNGERRIVDKCIDINISLPDFKTVHKLTAYILKDLPTDMILGLEFFKNIGCSINFKNQTIQMNGITQNFSTFTQPNNLLVEKASILLNKTVENQDQAVRHKLSERIEQSKLRNPELGKIACIEHQKF